MFFFRLFLVFSLLCFENIYAQKIHIPELKINFNEAGNSFIKFNCSNQVWLRYTDLNPGSQLDGYDLDHNFDIGLRRTRLQVTGKFDRILLYIHAGQNNLAFNSSRKAGIFIHDAIGEIEFIKDKFFLGAGLTGWAAYGRGAAASTTTQLALDVPVYQFSTLDISDQFIRKYAIYAKGLIGKINYRLALAKPMSIAVNTAQENIISQTASFALRPSALQTQAYIMYHFFETESNANCYFSGSYLGTKKIFNIGIGFLHQKNATWHKNIQADTLYENLNIYNIDAFLEYPFNREKQNAITLHAAYTYTDYGKNYVRNIGIMNPANGLNTQGSFNGAGNAYPMMGTGHNFMCQVAYIFKQDLLKDWGTLQPYFFMQYSQFEALNAPSDIYNFGVNWLLSGHKAKLTFQYENRPIFDLDTRKQQGRKGAFVTQLHLAI